MKKILPLLLMLSQISFGQNNPTFCFSLSLSAPRNTCGTITFDGNYVVGGIVGIGSDQNNFLAKCDGEGNILWSHELGSDFVDDYYSMIETSDHFIVVVGYANGKMCVVKYNSDGTEIWKKDIAVQTIDYLYDVIETSDGNYLVTGATEDFLQGWYYCAVIKITPDGDLVWNKNFYNGHNETGYSCIETADHHYVIGGYSNTINGGIFLLSLNENGSVHWTKKTSDGGIFYDLVATGDSAVVIAGYVCNTGGCGQMLSKIDSAGNPLWSYTYGDSLFGRFYSVAELPDGSFVAGGDATDQLTIFHGFIMRCDSNGQMLWGKTTNDVEFRSIAGSVDGGIVASATGGSGFKIVKMDPDGNSCPDCPSSDYGVQGVGTTFTDWSLSEFNAPAVITSSGMSEITITQAVSVYCSEVGIDEEDNKDSGLKVFPDPADELVNIHTTSAKLEITLLTIDGELVQQVSADQSPFQIQVKQLPEGIYLLRMNDGEKTYSEKIVVYH